jgi:hypothetical protein
VIQIGARRGNLRFRASRSRTRETRPSVVIDASPDARAAARPRCAASVLPVAAVETDHLAQEGERRDLLGRAAAERHEFAQQDRVGSVPGVAQPTVAGQIEIAVDRGSQRHAALAALRLEPARQVHLVPLRPDVHLGEVAAGRLGEEAELAGARPVGAVVAAGPLADGPVRRAASERKERAHAPGKSAIHDCVVVAPAVAGRVRAVEAPRLARTRGDLVPVDLNLYDVGAQRLHLVERGRSRGAAAAEEAGVVLHDQQLATVRARCVGHGESRPDGSAHEKDEKRGSAHGRTRLETGPAAGVAVPTHIPRARIPAMRRRLIPTRSPGFSSASPGYDAPRWG